MLQAWLRDHDGQYPRRGATQIREKRLAEWINRQRTQKDGLDARHILELQSLPGWAWDAVAHRPSSCQYVGADGSRCTSPPSRSAPILGMYYCKAHRTDAQGRVRLRSSPAQPRMVRPGKRRRLHGKQLPPRVQGRAVCDFPGCATTDQHRERVFEGSYCKRHARYVRRLRVPHVACCSLDEWTDDLVSTHRLGDMKQLCDKCGSLNFPEESIGTGARVHFSICCDNGKTKQLPRFEDPPSYLKELLTARS